MITIERYGDVVRLNMRHWRSRVAGYSASAYLTRGVLVDTGFPAAARSLARLVDELAPRAVALTHHHEDHAGNLRLLVRRGTPVALSDATHQLLREGEADVGLYRRLVWGRMAPLREPIVRLGDDELLAHGLALVPTPGHSPDHHAVWDAERRALYGGDLFLGVRVRVAQADEDPRAIALSARRAAALEPLVLFDAHRGRVDDPAAALRAKADWIDETVAAIERLAREGAPERTIVRETLGREDPVALVSLGDLSKRNFVRAVLGPDARRAR